MTRGDARREALRRKMKNVILGVVFSTAACAAVGSVSTMGRSLGGFSKAMGAFRVYFGASVVFSKRDVTVTTDMHTKYRAAYAYSDAGAQTFFGTWGAAVPAVPAGRDNVGDVAQVVGNPATALGAWRADSGRTFVFTGEMPANWLEHKADGAGWVLADVETAVTTSMMTRAMFAPLAVDPLPSHQGFVAEDDYVAKASDVTNLSYHTLGLRLEAGLGFRCIDTMTLFLKLSYRFDHKDKKVKNFKEDVFFKTPGEMKAFRAANGSALKENLIRSSFIYNNGWIASGMKVTADVKETVGVMGGLEWQPVRMLALSVYAGIKRYAVEVTYDGGDFAYPGTVGMYTESFTQENSRQKLLISQKGIKRTMKAVRWPVAFGGDVRVIFCGINGLHFGLEYTSFQTDLTFDKKVEDSDATAVAAVDRENARPMETFLTNPLSQPAAANFKDGLGTHQFAATDVVNVFTAKVEVRDLTLSAGYTLSL